MVEIILDLKSNAEVAFYTWSKLNPLNDDYVLSAAYLNLIGNVYVHCRQGKFESDWDDEFIEDIYGNTHHIKKFKQYVDLEAALLSSEEQSVFFDIDLDFFTINNGLSDGKFKFTYVEDSIIRNYFSTERPLIQWIFERLEGFTIAIEPEHTGGLLKSLKYLEIINKIYFKPGLFSWSCNWRHLSSK